jgi:fermentation-respiration switch protein FrsA (DUF1100 family)
MRVLIYTILIFFCSPTLTAQHAAGLGGKPPVDTPDILNWPFIPDGPNAVISNNGEYVLYRVWRVPRGGSSTIIYSVKTGWETSLVGARQPVFTNDSRCLIFITPQDSLCILTLPAVQREYEESVRSFKLFMHKDKEILIYQRANPERELVIHELTSGVKHIYDNINTYIVCNDNQKIVLQTAPDSGGQTRLLWVDIGTNKEKTIWKGSNTGSLCFDKSGEQLAFLVHDSTTDKNALWLYKADEENTVQLLKDESTDPTELMKIVAIDKFNRDGKKLFLRLGGQSLALSEANRSVVTVWGYSDPKLQTLQVDEKSGGAPSYLAILDIKSQYHHIWRIQKQNEIVVANNGNDLVLLAFREGSASERYWNKMASCNTFLAMVNEKKRIPIALTNTALSPSHKYLLGDEMAETGESELRVYEIATNTVRNITKSIPALPRKEENDMVETSSGRGLIIAGWLPADSGLLVYDDYDIWQVDPTGRRNATKLTNGREKKIQFRLAGDGSDLLGKVIQPDQPVLLTAFNTKTKQNGFYRLNWDRVQQPELLFMGDYFFSKTGANSFCLKARDRNIYLIRREQSSQAPNFFSTEDFHSFFPVSHLYPEKSVNWFTSELTSFTTADSTETQAILYKPENFNPGKKYPLLINYYDKTSDDLNRYRPLQGWLTETDLDVAWFASHGYLVLLTDIRYKIGNPGKSIYNAVVGAAKHILKRPYVDNDRIGIQGHSFGGYETNYLITHSNLFAAAVSSAGISDAMSFYGSLWPDGSSVQEYFEQRGFRIDSTPWQVPAIYANNSPILSISDVNTPVLMVQNKSDKNVYFEQGLEFFTALRRAGKRAWMLQYDNGGHGQTGEDYKDYLIRTSQFFNHYLKNAPPPEWMTRGIPAAVKGINDGLTDNDIETPENDLLINKDTGVEARHSVPE